MIEMGGFEGRFCTSEFSNSKISKLIGFHMEPSLLEKRSKLARSDTVCKTGGLDKRQAPASAWLNNRVVMMAAGIQGCIQKIHLASGSQLCAMLKRVDCFWPFATRTKET